LRVREEIWLIKKKECLGLDLKKKIAAKMPVREYWLTMAVGYGDV